jgi:hypothetical protein
VPVLELARELEPASPEPVSVRGWASVPVLELARELEPASPEPVSVRGWASVREPERALMQEERALVPEPEPGSQRWRGPVLPALESRSTSGRSWESA